MSYFRRLLTSVFLVAYLGATYAGEMDSQPHPTSQEIPSSTQMEKDLQQLPWKQFRSVVESVPKLKADVDAYGAFGWQFVQGQYSHYPWKKKIDKLDDTQKRQLAELIRLAKHPENISGSP